MFSLDNVESEEELEAWQSRLAQGAGAGAVNGYVCELKIDGLAVSITYENGLSGTRAATRGDGTDRRRHHRQRAYDRCGASAAPWRPSPAH